MGDIRVARSRYTSFTLRCCGYQQSFITILNQFNIQLKVFLVYCSCHAAQDAGL